MIPIDTALTHNARRKMLSIKDGKTFSSMSDDSIDEQKELVGRPFIPSWFAPEDFMKKSKSTVEMLRVDARQIEQERKHSRIGRNV